MKRVLLLMIGVLLLLNCSCHKSTDTPSVGEIAEQPEPQYMAYHLSRASRVGDDIYFVGRNSFAAEAQVFASEYGTENFEPFIPCFDAVCNHYDRTQCCIATGAQSNYTESLFAFMYEGEPSLLLFSVYDVSLSKPYSDEKLNLVCDDIVYLEYPKEDSEITGFLEACSNAPRKYNPLIYWDYFYYYEIKNGTRTQYRIPLTGGNPERVFAEDDIIITTVINEKFFGIRYETDEEDNTQMYYFRSDMNYENVEPLPEILDLFSLPTTEAWRLRTKVLLDADGDYLYVLDDMKVWKIPDSDIHAEPILLSDMTESLPTDLPNLAWDTLWYNDGVIYAVINTGHYRRPLLDSQGNPKSAQQWYEKSILYSFDIMTGECKTRDISNQRYIVNYIRYADDKYIYAEGGYAHDDGRGIQGVTIRLTLDTMRYEESLPNRFWEYSVETEAD